MRGSVALIFLLAGCSSGTSVDTTDAAVEKTCANTSCVEGASCVTGSGTVCRCYETGKWTCGDSTRPPEDGGFDWDAFPSAPPDTSPPPDAGTTRTIATCSTEKDSCDGEDPIVSAEAHLREAMVKCSAACTMLALYAKAGCPVRIEANVEWTTGALDCVAKEVSMYFWSCADEFHANTTGSCPD